MLGSDGQIGWMNIPEWPPPLCYGRIQILQESASHVTNLLMGAAVDGVSDAASSDDDEDAVGDDEDGWEPEPLNQPAGGIGDIPPPVILNPVPSNRHESHNRLSRKPTIRLFNDRPDRNAGAPLENVTKTSYETYQDALPKANAVPNVWAPFASKIDWEIAMWAKLRGPSSTALSELLNVEGVSVLFSVSAQHDTNYLLAAQYLGPLIQLCK